MYCLVPRHFVTFVLTEARTTWLLSFACPTALVDPARRVFRVEWSGFSGRASVWIDLSLGLAILPGAQMCGFVVGAGTHIGGTGGVTYHQPPSVSSMAIGTYSMATAIPTQSESVM